jgi:hypothetical protein
LAGLPNLVHADTAVAPLGRGAAFPQHCCHVIPLLLRKAGSRDAARLLSRVLAHGHRLDTADGLLRADTAADWHRRHDST